VSARKNNETDSEIINQKKRASERARKRRRCLKITENVHLAVNSKTFGD
jgi:hypothetical protein